MAPGSTQPWEIGKPESSEGGAIWKRNSPAPSSRSPATWPRDLSEGGPSHTFSLSLSPHFIIFIALVHIWSDLPAFLFPWWLFVSSTRKQAHESKTLPFLLPLTPIRRRGPSEILVSKERSSPKLWVLILRLAVKWKCGNNFIGV